jgi:hypothetical protein
VLRLGVRDQRPVHLSRQTGGVLTRRSWRLIPILPVLAAAACGGQGAPAPARSAARGDACREEAARGVAALFADLSAGRWRAADRRVARRDFVCS